ncbi:hypothetical protein CPC16_001580 [Podila verticillata]|nr:hypothetical protein BGZ52_010274 [Haplosporangium bisporale]KAF9213843.1 hypothetical protein BGZ59_004744 [Podila verticillata]KAF9373918.1 hypothetical protein CPC16_001580 [Podila verticillata]KFH72564.1 hypothetical protein MVEG_02853 [Podila verticillata NRRL 6337]
MLVTVFVVFTLASSTVASSAQSNMNLVCPATTPFGTCAVPDARLPPTDPPVINLHLTVIMLKEEKDLMGDDEATVEGDFDAVSPEGVKATTNAHAPVLKSPEVQQLSI